MKRITYHYRPRTNFTEAEMETLRASYATIERVSPDHLPRFHALFSGCADAALTQLADGGIKFVSLLARNERTRRNQRAAGFA